MKHHWFSEWLHHETVKWLSIWRVDWMTVRHWRLMSPADTKSKLIPIWEPRDSAAASAQLDPVNSVNTCTFVCWGTVWPAFFKHASNLDAHCQGLVLPLIFSSVVSGKSMSPRRLEFFGLTTLPFWTLPRRLEFFGLTILSFRTLQLARAFGLRVAGLFFVAAAAGAAYE